MRVGVLLVVLLAFAGAAVAAPSTPDQRVADLNWLVAQLEKNYAYRHKRNVDIPALARRYREDAVNATDEFKWIELLERLTAELYDHHVSLNTNTDVSPQLVPSGTDIWVEIIGGKPVIVEVRPRTIAWRAGVRAGMTVTALSVPRSRATDLIYTKLTRPGAEAEAFFTRMVLAGNHRDRRTFTACTPAGRCTPFDLPPAQGWRSESRIASEMLSGNIGYIRIENSLGDTATIAEFDRAVASLANAKGLILDLRNTPSGGNTDTAEPILGRFIAKRTGYQRVFEPRKGSDERTAAWVKEVDPRGPQITLPLVVLVNHWTGSMGEGMAIGLHGMNRATVVGTKMAGLLGGIDQFDLPNTNIGVRFPIERLYHVNGTPREDFVPDRLVTFEDKSLADPILAAGLTALRAKLTR